MKYKQGCHPNSRKHQFKKGMIPWNKNRQKLICKQCGKEYKVRLSQKKRSKFCSRKCKYESRKGSIPWNRGLTKETSKWAMKSSKRMKSNNPMKNLKIAKKVRMDNASRQKLLWKNPEYKERTMRMLLKFLFKRPTKLEKKYINFFNKFDFPFDYCGDGSLLIGYRNPDFVENNGRKLCIEVSNKKEKSIKRKGRKYQSWQEYEKQRINHFAKYGWKCIVLWEEELKDTEALRRKIINFCK